MVISAAQGRELFATDRAGWNAFVSWHCTFFRATRFRFRRVISVALSGLKFLTTLLAIWDNRRGIILERNYFKSLTRDINFQVPFQRVLARVLKLAELTANERHRHPYPLPSPAR